MPDRITFETLIAIEYETPKAFKVYGGDYYPKSRCSVVYTSDEYEVLNEGTKRLVTIREAEITMPGWVAKR